MLCSDCRAQHILYPASTAHWHLYISNHALTLTLHCTLLSEERWLAIIDMDLQTMWDHSDEHLLPLPLQTSH